MAGPHFPVPFGEGLRTRRLATGLSLRALARRCGVAASTISRIENGLFTPTWLTAVRLAEVVGLELPAPQAARGTPSASGPPGPSGSRDGEGKAQSLTGAASPVAVRRQVLRPGVRKDLRRIASGRPYRFLVVLDGEVQIRARDGSRVSLGSGLRLDCDLLRQDSFFAVAAKPAELLWIG